MEKNRGLPGCILGHHLVDFRGSHWSAKATAMSPAARAAAASLIAGQSSSVAVSAMLMLLQCCWCRISFIAYNYPRNYPSCVWLMLVNVGIDLWLRTGWFQAKLLFSEWLLGMWIRFEALFLILQVSAKKAETTCWQHDHGSQASIHTLKHWITLLEAWIERRVSICPALFVLNWSSLYTTLSGPLEMTWVFPKNNGRSFHSEGMFGRFWQYVMPSNNTFSGTWWMLQW